MGDTNRELPQGATLGDEPDFGHSFLVAQRDENGWQRAVHRGFFLTVPDAISYLNSRDDRLDLAITFLIDRYPIRDLSPSEISQGCVSPTEALSMTEHLNKRNPSPRPSQDGIEI